MKELVDQYLLTLPEKGYKPISIEVKGRFLRRFLEWCEERSIEHIDRISPYTLQRYQKHLYHYRTEEGEALSFDLQRRRISEVKSFFEYLLLEGQIERDLAGSIELPKKPNRLPAVLSVKEALKVLAEPDETSPTGIRDRTLLELLYATGIRRHEAAKLEIWDIDLLQGWVMIRAGHGDRDRSVPLLERTESWLTTYLHTARPVLVGPQSQTVSLFVGKRGKGLSAPELGVVVRKHIRQAGIEKRGAFRLFSNSLVVWLIQGGMDLRYIQEIMGHIVLESTNIYSKATITHLKEVHQQTHPSNYPRKK